MEAAAAETRSRDRNTARWYSGVDEAGSVPETERCPRCCWIEEDEDEEEEAGATDAATAATEIGEWKVA